MRQSTGEWQPATQRQPPIQRQSPIQRHSATEPGGVGFCPGGSQAWPGRAAQIIADRVCEALCVDRGRPGQDAGAAKGLKQEAWESSGGVAGRQSSQRDDAGQRGSAVVEFTFLGLLLMVPVVYFIITVGKIQGGSFAVVGAADQAAKVFVAQPDEAAGRAAAEQAAVLALADYGHSLDNASVEVSCDRGNCMAAGSAVTVTADPAAMQSPRSQLTSTRAFSMECP